MRWCAGSARGGGSACTGWSTSIALLAIVHYCMQSKLDLWEPTIMAGIYAWLMGYRLLVQLVGVRGKLPLAWVGALSLAAPVLTALGEAVYFWLALGVDPARVLSANWSLRCRMAAGGHRAGARSCRYGDRHGRAIAPVIVKRLPGFA